MRIPGRWRKARTALVLTLYLLVSTLAVAQASAPEARKTLLVMGDSLSAAYGLAAEQGWVALLDKRLTGERPHWRVVNASISGETTAGGAARIDAALKEHTPALVAIELGANDGLRGLPLEHTRANLERMVTAAKQSGAQVLLIGIRIPPNYGPEYAQAFDAIYADLAREQNTALLPFLLAPVVTDRDAFLPDNLHPTAASQPKLLDHVWTVLAPLLD
ncbi:arylesterase [Chiayiivirga flava]|uniref:Acyl-CoA thioesterase-1 n=1 Tax=Chiayiivirga flava TaxID=659595 RepID=A0A7W8D5D6_9GAMM|nr:arylesterase [Chiayiivirga flava]MBB5208226.1 acyl-CoA thioesterase-1 [Chiayiivirga flava]